MGHPHRRFIASYVHHGRVGVLVEFGVETDFVTKTPEFLQLSSDIAMQIAALNPSDVASLLRQTFVKDDAVPVSVILDRAMAELKETIVIGRFIRWDDQQSGEHPEPPKSPAQIMRLGKR